MEIPYTVEERPDTGLNNVKLGIWLFLASEVMLFGGLFSTYVLLRVIAVEWPFGADILSVPIGAFNTVVLITSSVTMVLAYAGLKTNDLGKFKLYMAVTIGLSLLFLGVKGYEYADKFSHGDYPSSSTYLGIYFTLTGLHALHIIGGVDCQFVFSGTGLQDVGERPRNSSRIGLKPQGSTGTSSTSCGSFCFRCSICSSTRSSGFRVLSFVGGRMSEDVQAHIRTYMKVGVSLLVLTVVTVAVSYLPFGVPLAVTIALIIAVFKGSLVASFFMHLIGETEGDLRCAHADRFLLLRDVVHSAHGERRQGRRVLHAAERRRPGGGG